MKRLFQSSQRESETVPGILCAKACWLRLNFKIATTWKLAQNENGRSALRTGH